MCGDNEKSKAGWMTSFSLVAFAACSARLVFIGRAFGKLFEGMESELPWWSGFYIAHHQAWILGGIAAVTIFGLVCVWGRFRFSGLLACVGLAALAASTFLLAYSVFEPLMKVMQEMKE